MVRVLFGIAVLSIISIQLVYSVPPLQKERSIVSEDFTKKRPRPRRHTGRNPSRTYRLASTPLSTPASGVDSVPVGVTIWKVQRSIIGYTNINEAVREDIVTRVEADTQFKKGELLRLSIESPNFGYLYVVDRDWFTDGSSGATNLIFPERGENNRLVPGKLIEIPGENRPPFKTDPKSNQAGERLTIIITSTPLPLPLSKQPLPVASTQLAQWEDRWSSLTERFEMNGGAGEARTIEEEQAVSSRGTRQLTRDDPAPQTIYLLTPRRGDGLLFNLMLSYTR